MLALKWNCLLTFPFFALILAFAEEIAVFIYGDAWTPAVPVLYILAVNALLVPINGLLYPILNAVGHSGRLLALSAVWAAGAWLLAGALVVTGMDYQAVGFRPGWKPARRICVSVLHYEETSAAKCPTTCRVPGGGRRRHRSARLLFCPSAYN